MGWRAYGCASSLLALMAASSPALGAEPVEPARVQLLAEHLERVSSLAVIEPYLPAIGGTLCAAGAVGLAAAEHHELHPSPVAAIAPVAGCAVVSFASYALPREYQGSVSYFAFMTAGGAPIGMYAATAPGLSDAARVTLLGFSIGGVAVSALRLVDSLVERPVTWTALSADAKALRAHGTRASRAELHRMEAQFRRAMVRPIRPWVYGATLVLSSFVSASPALISTTEPREKVAALGFAGVGLFTAGLYFATPNAYDRYVGALSRVQLSPLGPSNAAGLWLSGTF